MLIASEKNPKKQENIKGIRDDDFLGFLEQLVSGFGPTCLQPESQISETLELSSPRTVVQRDCCQPRMSSAQCTKTRAWRTAICWNYTVLQLQSITSYCCKSLRLLSHGCL